MGKKLQVLDVDYVMLNNQPLVRLFCKDVKGRSFCVFYKGHYPYLYAKPKDDEQRVLEVTKERFSGDLRNIERVQRTLPMGYHPEKEDLLKITVKTPMKIRDLRESLAPYAEIYEADILYKYRFMADMGITGMGWIEVEGTPTSTSTVYCPVIEADEITPIESDENAPLSYLTLDIETVPEEEGGFAEAENDPIVMISLIFEPMHDQTKSVVLASRPGTENARCFSSEEEMLEEFANIVRNYDPDVIVGYNQLNYDLPYILTRMEEHGISRDLGRADKQVYARHFGNRTRVDILGRVVADPYAILKKPEQYQKFKRYNLDTIAEEVLGEKKIDVDHKEFHKAWRNREPMGRYVEYCRKDSVLAFDIVKKMDMLGKYFALSRLSGITLQDCLNGGQSARIEQLLLRVFNERGYVLPMKPDDAENERRRTERAQTDYTGGLVLEPDVGLHTDGITLVLDFKSLYPSIIRTYNICPTTLVSGDHDGPVHDAPSGADFVKREERDGIIPSILANLIDERTVVKKEMAEAEGDKRKILDDKQFALKIMSNSFYGYIGYLRARTYILDVANAITAYGRKLIEDTKETVEKRGYHVVYGDTDSVMIKVPTTNLEEAKAIGDDLSEEITNSLPGRLELEFEKAFRSFLILTKKRYAGWAFEKRGDEWHDKVGMKGIETVRRDWCDMVSDTMEDVLGTILKEGDISTAIETVQDKVKQIKDGEIDLEKLAITKGLTKKPERYDGTIPHVELARRMKKRNPGDPPGAGDRIQFVIISGNALISQRAEDPEYIRENGLRIDADYYINSQLLPPLERIFNVLDVEKPELLGDGRQVSIHEALRGETKDRNRDVSYETDPKKAVVDNLEGFTCQDCKSSYRRVPLSGKCDCGGEIFAYGDGMVGKTVSV